MALDLVGAFASEAGVDGLFEFVQGAAVGDEDLEAAVLVADALGGRGEAQVLEAVGGAGDREPGEDRAAAAVGAQQALGDFTGRANVIDGDPSASGEEEGFDAVGRLLEVLPVVAVVGGLASPQPVTSEQRVKAMAIRVRRA